MKKLSMLRARNDPFKALKFWAVSKITMFGSFVILLICLIILEKSIDFAEFGELSENDNIFEYLGFGNSLLAIMSLISILLTIVVCSFMIFLYGQVIYEFEKLSRQSNLLIFRNLFRFWLAKFIMSILVLFFWSQNWRWLIYICVFLNLGLDFLIYKVFSQILRDMIPNETEQDFLVFHPPMRIWILGLVGSSFVVALSALKVFPSLFEWLIPSIILFITNLGFWWFSCRFEARVSKEKIKGN